MNDVPRDGQTMGEIVMRGNNVMAGYYRDEVATKNAFEGGWLHLGSRRPALDGYVELRDRAKDIVIAWREHLHGRDRARDRGASGGVRGRRDRRAGPGGESGGKAFVAAGRTLR